MIVEFLPQAKPELLQQQRRSRLGLDRVADADRLLLELPLAHDQGHLEAGQLVEGEATPAGILGRHGFGSVDLVHGLGAEAWFCAVRGLSDRRGNFSSGVRRQAYELEAIGAGFLRPRAQQETNSILFPNSSVVLLHTS